MKVRKISFENHPILGNLALDFTDKNSNTVNTIILAGENGVGKSLLLNTIYEFSNIKFHPLPSKLGKYSLLGEDEKAIFEIELYSDEFLIAYQYESPQNYRELHIWEITFSKENGRTVSKSKILSQIPHPIITTHLTGNSLRTIFSDAEVNFSQNEVSVVTSQNIDRENIKNERSNNNSAKNIAQLLVDIQSLDALELSEWAKNNVGNPIQENIIDKRVKRFTSAFDLIFPSKKYKGLENIEGRKQIVFEENGREMTIDKLSSGEKQIVFRGSFLLKDKKSTKGALTLIDEPEISLHPKWQLEILNFFKKLFTDESGEQTSQLIVATHSPFIIHNANRSEDKVIVLKKDENGKIQVLSQPKFYSWSPEKIVQEAFDVSHILETNKVVIFLEGETDEKYFNKCLEAFEMPQDKIEFKWIGRINEQGNAENTGDTALNQAKTFFCAHMEFIKSKVILLYDNDTNKPKEDVENLFIRKMTKNDENLTFKKGVENLLTIPADFDINQFYDETIKPDEYSGKTTLTKLNKTRLCSYICEELQINEQKVILEKIKLEIESVLSLIE